MIKDKRRKDLRVYLDWGRKNRVQSKRDPFIKIYYLETSFGFCNVSKILTSNLKYLLIKRYHLFKYL